MAMNMFMMAKGLQMNSMEKDVQKQSLELQMDGRLKICSSESFGRLAGAQVNMQPLPMY